MIRYKKYQNKNEKNVSTFNKWYARAVCEETVDIAGLAEHMSNHNTPFSTGAIHGILKDMVNCIKELLIDGKNVKIDDLGIFSVGLRSKGSPTPEEFSTLGNITGVRLRARATGNLSSASLKLTAKLREYTEYSNGETAPDNGGGSGSESPDEI
ncbi:MAG: DNA-binding protein [Parabacteroides sp.]|nr:DNA-binding protein [Parabacteroides sp.]